MKNIQFTTPKKIRINQKHDINSVGNLVLYFSKLPLWPGRGIMEKTRPEHAFQIPLSLLGWSTAISISLSQLRNHTREFFWLPSEAISKMSSAYLCQLLLT